MKEPFFFAVAAVTIDGFIARFPGHKSDWTSKEDKAHLHKMEKAADVLLLGRASFEVAKKKLSKKNCLVLSRKVNGIRKKTKNLTFLNPKSVDVKKFVKDCGYKKICVLGGRAAYNYCLKKNLLDEIFVTIEPIVFGKGIPMFDSAVKTKTFTLVLAKKLNAKGTLLLHYKKK
ncbi:MAG: dihydrofolate reductase [Candidatus Diapherotrites archaeon]|nr:dihydrofolate reductase [Candidatus Diapherotrites archaeon]